MPRSKAATHLHRYKRVNLTRNPDKEPYMVFRCTKPVCSHYVPVGLSLGKMSECNRCGEPFIMNKISVELALPHCDDCTKRKNTENTGNAALVAEFLKEHGS